LRGFEGGAEVFVAILSSMRLELLLQSSRDRYLSFLLGG
jgi:hypothetical protein